MTKRSKGGYQGKPKQGWREGLARLPFLNEGSDEFAPALERALKRSAVPATRAELVEGILAGVARLGMDYCIAALDTPNANVKNADLDAWRDLAKVSKVLSARSRRMNHERALALSSVLFEGLIAIYRMPQQNAHDRQLAIRDLWTSNGLFLFEDELDELVLTAQEVSESGGQIAAAATALGKVLNRSDTQIRNRRRRLKSGRTKPSVLKTPQRSKAVVNRVFRETFGWDESDARIASEFWMALTRNAPVELSELKTPSHMVEAFNLRSATPRGK
ncbi:MAG: hypothetical protein QM704_00490 [Anaeromyxobacteraceae bacterium]